MTDLPFDFRRLAADLSAKISQEDRSLRDAAEEIGTSAATLSRMLKGDSSDILPDTKTLLRAVSWLGKRIADYEPSLSNGTSSLADVELHLRALPGLNDRDKDVLVALVRTAHDQFGTRRKKV